MTLDITVQNANGSSVKLTLADDTMIADVVEFFESLGITDWDLDYRNRNKPAMIYDGDLGKVVVCAPRRHDYGLFAAVALNTLWS